MMENIIITLFLGIIGSIIATYFWEKLKIKNFTFSSFIYFLLKRNKIKNANLEFNIKLNTLFYEHEIFESERIYYVRINIANRYGIKEEFIDNNEVVCNLKKEIYNNFQISEKVRNDSLERVNILETNLKLSEKIKIERKVKARKVLLSMEKKTAIF